jgi:predicted dehydrogenase
MTNPCDMSHDSLRVGVIGVGHRAKIATLVQQPGLNAIISAAADTSHHGARRSAELFGSELPFFTSHTELINSGLCDAVIITTPDDTHAQIATDFLRAGISVFLEKPLAITTEDADAVLLAAFESGTRLYVGHNMRHMSVVKQMRELIAAGEIGEVRAIWCRHFVGNGGDFYFKDWHAERARTNSLLLQKGAHDIDVMHWLADSYTQEVVAMGDLMVYGNIQSRSSKDGQLMREWFSEDNWPPTQQKDLNPVVDVEDISMILMRMESGVLGSYEQCHFTPDYWRNYTVIGTRGRLENFGDGDGGVIRLWNKRKEYNPDGDQSFPIRSEGAGHSAADALTIAEFVEFARNGTATQTSPISARQAVATGAAATTSLRSGSIPQTIAPLDASLTQYFDRHQSASPLIRSDR